VTAAVIITGCPGAGKTSVLAALASHLERDGVAFSALETEQLAWGAPWLWGPPWLAQVAAVLAIQRAAGRRLFLLTATIESAEDLDAFREAVGTDRIMVVLLEVDPEVASARIAAREPDHWVGKAYLVDAARRLAVSIPRALRDVDHRLAGDTRDPLDLAAEIARRI